MKKLLLILGLILTGSLYADYSCLPHLEEFKQCLSEKQDWECHDSLLKSYSGNLYRSLNKSLRKIKYEEECNQLATSLAHIVSALPSEKRTVYRGMGLISELQFIKPGECFLDEGFVSTSSDSSVAKRFTLSSLNDSGSAFLKIKALNSKSIFNYSSDYGEHEFLLLPKTALKLQSRRKDSRNINYFVFKEVESSECISNH